MDASTDALSACHGCGLLQAFPGAASPALVSCARCGATLRRVRRHSELLCAACAVAGLTLFLLAFFLPTASVWMQGGRFATGDLLSGPERLRQAGAWGLEWAVIFTLLLVPLAKLLTVLAMTAGVLVGQFPPLRVSEERQAVEHYGLPLGAAPIAALALWLSTSPFAFGF